eukprot:c12406_g1_i3.p2 GENE.c12406_g1_i3~~c12406_g1_i3.p2  ORF type:complete len:402 (+),score=91.09 c12406_g1_i3:1219-2424(+)
MSCSLWAGGHVSTFASLHYNLQHSRMVGDHVVYSRIIPSRLAERGQPLKTVLGKSSAQQLEVSAHLRPLHLSRGNLTVVDRVTINFQEGADYWRVLSIGSRQANATSDDVAVQLNCGSDLSSAIVSAPQSTLQVADSPFTVRRDAMGRWVVTVAGSQARVIVQPWNKATLGLLLFSVHIVDAAPSLKVFEKGICTLNANDIAISANIPLLLDEVVRVPRSVVAYEDAFDCDKVLSSTSLLPTSSDAYAISAANQNILALLEISEQVSIPSEGESSQRASTQDALQPRGSSRHALAHKLIALSVSDEAVSVGCANDDELATANKLCGVVANTDVFSLCVLDVCQMPDFAQSLVGAHADATVTQVALRHAIDVRDVSTIDTADYARWTKDTSSIALVRSTCPL